MIGAKQMLTGGWAKPGVWNIEQHDPDAFMADLNENGLPWQFVELTPEQAAAFDVSTCGF
jgi:saccharopine dehydrogenase (NAD+, L-lysine-forming)